MILITVAGVSLKGYKYTMRKRKCVVNAEDFILYALDIIAIPTDQVLTPDILYVQQQSIGQLTDSLINYLII